MNNKKQAQACKAEQHKAMEMQSDASKQERQIARAMHVFFVFVNIM
jgi:hypothetical protein